MHENLFPEECMFLIESKLNWGPSVQWTASHFYRLSDDIFAKTGKRVSDSTLKRLFGKKETRENYNPQLYTKNALAEYLGYTDWQTFTAELKKKNQTQPLPKSKKKINPKIIAFAVLLIIVGVSVIFIPSKKEKAWLKTADTLRTVPFTAVFNYDVSRIRDSVYIDFGNNVRIPLPKDKHTITEFYKSCGVFYPRIMISEAVLDSVCLQNLSGNWQGGYSPNDDYKKFLPFEDSTAFDQVNRLYVAPENLKFPDPLYNDGIYAEYRLMKNFNASLDSMNVNMTVKNSPAEGGKLCYDIEIWLIGSRNNCRIRFVEPGCFRYGQLKISEKEFNGRFDNLSALERNFKDWQNIGIQILDNKAEILYNQTPVITQSYKQSLGKFLGIYVRFYGTGSLRNVNVLDYKNRNIYQSNF